MLQVITITAYAFSVISFLLFVVLLITNRKGAPPSAPPGLGDAQVQGALSDMAKLLEALAKLSDSFAKAGPLVMTLVATIFFLLVAMMGSGFESLAK